MTQLRTQVRLLNCIANEALTINWPALSQSHQSSFPSYTVKGKTLQISREENEDLPITRDVYYWPLPSCCST